MAASETLTLDARRQAAAARIGSVELPSFKGKAGWEFTPLKNLDLDAPAGRALGHAG